jgi:phage gpG-like protein
MSVQLAMEMFKKRYRDLSPDEMKQWRSEWQKRRIRTDPDFRERRYSYWKKWASKNMDRVRENARRNQKPYYQKNKIRMRDNWLRYKDKLRNQFFERYGRSCACCGEDNPMFLSIEHLNGNGAEHRRQLNRESPDSIMADIRKNGWPDGYATLCMNCNFAKWRNGGMCPHEQEVKKIMLGIVA